MTAVPTLKSWGGLPLHRDGPAVIPAESVGLSQDSRAFLSRGMYVGEFAESRLGLRGRAEHGPESSEPSSSLGEMSPAARGQQGFLRLGSDCTS